MESIIESRKFQIAFWILGIGSIVGTLILVDQTIFSLQVLFTLEIQGSYGIFIIFGTIMLIIIGIGALFYLVQAFDPKIFLKKRQKLSIVLHPKRLKMARILKRVEITLMIIFLGISLIFSGRSLGISVRLNQYLADQRKPPWLLMVDNPATSIRICWETQTPNELNLAWGTIPNTLDKSAKGNQGLVHLVDLINLTPSTTYYYRVDGFDTVYNFTTAPSNPSSFRFIKNGDSQYSTTYTYDVSGIGGSAEVSSRMKTLFTQNGKPTFDFYLTSGDQVDRSKPDHYKRYFADWEWAMTQGVPWIAASGNHETYYDADLNLYHQYFNYTGTRSMPGAPENFWTAYGNMLIITVFLSSSGSFIYDTEPRAGVLTWLESILASQSQNYDWVVINQHHPLYVSAWYPSADNQLGYDPVLVRLELPLIKSYGVDLVLAGHWHSYERLVKDNCTFIVNGAGGGPLDGWGNSQSSANNPQNADSKATNYDIYGFSVFDVAGSRLNLTTYAINGTILDTVTLYTH